MSDALLALAGRMVVWAELKLQFLVKSRRTPGAGGDYDKTGLPQGEHPVPGLLWKDGGLIYPAYESPAHSLWRAQELSLFHRHRSSLSAPVLDFGCGDGSFAAMVFDRLDTGVDNDPEALEAAGRLSVYGRRVRSTADAIPLPDGSHATVISNSVLEHVSDLDGVLKELARVLAPGGRLFITVPTRGFWEHLERFFGRAEADRVNEEYVHRNLFTAEEWGRRLAGHGFVVEKVLAFQPARVTFWYRMFRLLGRKGLGRLSPRMPSIVWRAAGGRLRRLVRRSIAGVRQGANIFVVARRR